MVAVGSARFIAGKIGRLVVSRLLTKKSKSFGGSRPTRVQLKSFHELNARFQLVGVRPDPQNIQSVKSLARILLLDPIGLEQGDCNRPAGQRYSGHGLSKKNYDAIA
jgi:hypothetical protein